MTQTVYFLKGLPGSGKSTWAFEKIKELPKNSIKRINKDDLRNMLDGGAYCKGSEEFVLGLRDGIIGRALNKGKHVIIDDTNFEPKHLERINGIVKNYNDHPFGKCNATIKIIDHFLDVPLEECIQNDLKRHNSVGKDVIMNMFNRYLKDDSEHNPTTIIQDTTKPHCVIFDIDGTLALRGERTPYEWQRCGEDTVNPPVYRLYQDLRLAGMNIILVSGRDSICREVTEEWLEFHDITYEELHMRPQGDCRKDTVVKEEILEQKIIPNWYVHYVVDDRRQVVDMFRDKGLAVFQVAPGEF